MRLRIRTRLTAWYVLLLAGVLTAVGLFVVFQLRATLTDEINRSLATVAPQLARGWESEGSKDFLEVANSVLPATPAGPAAAQIVGADDRVLAAYGAPLLRRPILPPAVVASLVGKAPSKRTVSVQGAPHRVFSLPVRRAGENQVLVVAKSLTNRDAAVSRLATLLLVAFPVAVAVSAAGGWLLARRALRPVEQLTSRADAIGADGFAERIPVPEPRDEIAHLAATLNAMLARLQQGLADRRRLVADASHELRTPLAAMQAELDVTLRHEELPAAAREVLASTREEVEHMNALVNNLLTLARIDEGQLELDAAPVDLEELLGHLVGRLAPLAARAGLELAADTRPVTVVGDRERLREVTSNLVMNAIKFAGPGAHVTATTWRHGDSCGFTVSDDGPGVSPRARRDLRTLRARRRVADTGARRLGTWPRHLSRDRYGPRRPHRARERSGPGCELPRRAAVRRFELRIQAGSGVSPTPLMCASAPRACSARRLDRRAR